MSFKIVTSDANNDTYAEIEHEEYNLQVWNPSSTNEIYIKIKNGYREYIYAHLSKKDAIKLADYITEVLNANNR